MTDKRNTTRRNFLKAAALGGTLAGLPQSAWAQKANSLEDLWEFLLKFRKKPKRGAPKPEWGLTDPAMNHEIEGFASRTAVEAGDSITFFVSTSVRTDYTLEIYRLGWYNGAGADRVYGPVTLRGTKQRTPDPDPVTGMVECDWSPALEIRTRSGQSEWKTGLYVVKLSTIVNGMQSYMRFVVTDDRWHDLLFQSSVTTDQAYNPWGGKSLYNFNSDGGQAAYTVSFDRPYGTNITVNDEDPDAFIGAGDLFEWEYNLVRFLERERYDVGYCTNIETHYNSSPLYRCRGFLSVGHDEYWSAEMRQNVTAMRDRRVDLGFFGANTCYWQIRFEASRGSTNRQTGRIVAYKDVDFARDRRDPYVDGPSTQRILSTVRWRDTPVQRPEDNLVGVMYYFNSLDQSMVIDDTKSASWVFSDTRLKRGDVLPGLLGYEVDRIFPATAPAGIVSLCKSPVANRESANMSIYTAPSGALVFATGSNQWPWGLDDFEVPPFNTGSQTVSRLNEAAQQMTRNVLDRFVRK